MVLLADKLFVFVVASGRIVGLIHPTCDMQEPAAVAQATATKLLRLEDFEGALTARGPDCQQSTAVIGEMTIIHCIVHEDHLLLGCHYGN